LSAGKAISVSYVDYGDVTSTITIDAMEVGEMQIHTMFAIPDIENVYLKTPATASAKYIVMHTGVILGPSTNFSGGMYEQIYQGALLRIS